jgi:hypothetical protein
MALFAVVLTTLCGISWTVSAYELKCENTALVKADVSLPSKLLLPTNYSIAVRFTDWQTNLTSKYEERNFTDSLVISRTNRSSTLPSTWIKTPKHLLFLEGKTCGKQPEESLSLAYGISERLTTFFGRNITSFADVLEAVISRTYTQTGWRGISVVQGVESLDWVGCARNITKDNKTHVEIDVSHVSSKSNQQPYSSDFANPTVLSIHIIVYEKADPNNTKNATILEHLSFDLVSLEKTIHEEKESALLPPRGTFCSNMPNITLPSQLPERFEANIEYANSEKKTVNTVELMFDEEHHIMSYALDFDVDSDIPFAKNPGLPTDLRRARVVHDFNFGHQYLLSKDNRVCKEVAKIPLGSADVRAEGDTLYMRTPSDVLLADTHNDFVYYAGKVCW